MRIKTDKRNHLYLYELLTTFMTKYMFRTQVHPWERDQYMEMY